VNQSGAMLKVKWGVAHMIIAASIMNKSNKYTGPVVIPLVHVGMEKIMPLSVTGWTKYIPRIGKKVHILVGEPMNFDDIVTDLMTRRAANPEIAQAAMRETMIQIMVAIEQRLVSMHLELQRITKNPNV